MFRTWALLVAASVLSATSPVAAQDYPNKPVRIVVGFAAGSASDLVARAVGQKLSVSLGQPSIVELEAIVGGRLFLQGASLTGKGQFVEKYARRILALNDQIIAGEGRKKNQIRVGLPTMYSSTLLGKVVSACQHVPGLRFYSDIANLLRKFDEGHLDIIVSFSTTQPKGVLSWWTEKMVWVSAASFLLSPGAPLPLLIWPGSVASTVAQSACREANAPYEVVFTATDTHSHLEAIRASMGYYVFSAHGAPDDLKIANEYFLPKLQARYASIRVNPDLDNTSDVVACIEQAIRSEISEKLKNAG